MKLYEIETSVSINKILLEPQPYPFGNVNSCFGAIPVLLGSCYRNGTAPKAYNSYSLALYWKNLLTPDIQQH